MALMARTRWRIKKHATSDRPSFMCGLCSTLFAAYPFKRNGKTYCRTCIRLVEEQDVKLASDPFVEWLYAKSSDDELADEVSLEVRQVFAEASGLGRRMAGRRGQIVSAFQTFRRDEWFKRAYSIKTQANENIFRGERPSSLDLAATEFLRVKKLELIDQRRLEAKGKREAKARGAGISETHGRINDYVKRRCRCDVCRANWAAYLVSYRERREQKSPGFMEARNKQKREHERWRNGWDAGDITNPDIDNRGRR